MRMRCTWPASNQTDPAVAPQERDWAGRRRAVDGPFRSSRGSGRLFKCGKATSRLGARAQQGLAIGGLARLLVLPVRIRVMP
jgi:hypothetical protein